MSLTPQRVLDAVDLMERDVFRLYLRIQRTRFALQNYWQCLPTGGGWVLRDLTERNQERKRDA